MTQYDKINSWIDQLWKLDVDSPQFAQLSTLAADRIAWARKFNKINKEQSDKLCERMIELFET